MRVVNKEIQCGHCHEAVSIDVVLSQSISDTTIDGNQQNEKQYKMIQICPHCGHVALDISKPVQSIATLQYENDDLFTNQLIQGAKTYVLNKNNVLASYMYRLVSWKLDKQKELSQKYMQQSIQYLEYYLKELPVIKEENLPYFVILIDCYRQVGSFQQAQDLCQEVLENLSFFNNQQLTLFLDKVIQLEMTFIQNQDTNIHYYHEVK